MEDLATAMALKPLLRGVGIVFAFLSAVLAVRDFLAGATAAGIVSSVSAAALAGAAALLFARPLLPLRQLRGLELMTFGAMGVSLAVSHYARILAATTAGNAAAATAHWHEAALHCLLLLVAYGILVPNTWRRAAFIVLPTAAIPFALGLSVRSQNPEASVISGLATAATTTPVLVAMTAGVAVAILGTLLTSKYRAGYVRASLAGMYDLVEKIGTGGMGEVWLARHHLLSRPAAIKLIRPELLGGSDASSGARVLRRFEREAQVTAKLRSPHTVELYDFGLSQSGVFYYVMEYLDGLDLATLVERFGPVPVERAVHFLLQACDALGDAHDHNLIHRDIKPANIHACRMGIKYDFIKVLDFGIVKQEKEQGTNPATTAEGTATGTPAYMAPEMITGADPTDARSDLYSLGCVGYWLVTGRPLFESGTPLGVLVEHVKTEPSPASQRAEIPIPPELDRILLKCVAKKPVDRFQSARELADALAACPVPENWTNARAEQWWKLHQPQS